MGGWGSTVSWEPLCNGNCYKMRATRTPVLQRPCLIGRGQPMSWDPHVSYGNWVGRGTSAAQEDGIKAMWSVRFRNARTVLGTCSWGFSCRLGMSHYLQPLEETCWERKYCTCLASLPMVSIPPGQPTHAKWNAGSSVQLLFHLPSSIRGLILRLHLDVICYHQLHSHQMYLLLRGRDKKVVAQSASPSYGMLHRLASIAESAVGVCMM